MSISRNIVQSSVELIILLVALFFTLEIQGIASTLIISNTIMLLLLYKYSKNLFHFKKGFDKPLLTFSISSFFIFIISNWLSQIDTIMLGHFTNVKEIAIYNVAMPTAQTIFLISTALLSVFLPTISEKYAKKQSIETEYKKTFHWILLLAIPFSVLLIFFSQKIVEIFFGSVYYLASIPLSILAASLLIFSLSRPSFNVLLMLNKTKILLKLSISIIIIDILLNLCLIPLSLRYYQYGMYGASIATGISFIILSLLTIKYAKKYSKIPIFDKTAWKITFSGILALIPLLIIRIMVKNQNIFNIILYLVLFGILYLFFLFVLNCFDEEDKKISLALKEKFQN